jgi:hypothetical protein
MQRLTGYLKDIEDIFTRGTTTNHACSTVTKFNCDIENMKQLKFNSQQTFIKGNVINKANNEIIY